MKPGPPQNKRIREHIKKLLRQGHSDKEIAGYTDLSHRMIRWYVQDIKRELGLYGPADSRRLIVRLIKGGRMRKLMLVVAVLLFAGMAKAQTCTPVAVDTWANHSDDGKGPTEVWTLHRKSTNTNWSETIYQGSPNTGPINAAADTYTFSVEFGADAQGYTTLRSGFGGCQLTNWSVTEYVGRSVKDLNTGVTTSFPNASYVYTNCTGYACRFDFTDGGDPYTLISGHDYIFYAGIESIVPGVGQSGVWTYSLRVNVQ